MSTKCNNVRVREQSSKISTPTIDVSSDQQKPKISLEFLGGKYCISKCETNQKADVIDTLYRISQSSWRELHQLGKSCGYEMLPLSQIKCSKPNSSLFEHIDKATVFHKKGKIPIVGMRKEETFYIFCIDRSFDAYDHG